MKLALSLVGPSHSMFALVYAIAGAGKRHQLPPGETIVGRLPTCDLGCTLTALGSRHGILVNDPRIAEAEVADGDTVVVGAFRLQVESSAADECTVFQVPLGDPSQAIYRPVQRAGTTQAHFATTVDPGRLLTLLFEISRTLVRPSRSPMCSRA